MYKFLNIILFTIFLVSKSYAEIINKVEIINNERITKETIIVFSNIQIGKDYDANNLDQVIKDLYGTNFFSNISLSSNVEGIHNKRLSKLNSLLAGFPAGTVSGAPKIRAMEIIDKLEKSKRKVYAGGIGYFSSNGDFDTCIALRTALTKKDKFYVQAGAGIVADSKPNNEYDETVNKAKALISALK